jgi:RNase P subunit RPR2
MVGNSMPNNPLSGYFRQPAIYITLPSGGKYWPNGTLDMPETGELPVYPMTAIDEITYRTPDALFNGDAVVRVIQSCIPAIKNAWGAPAADMDAILTGIRIASYGHSMDIDTKCPNCGEESTFSLDLRQVVDGLQFPDYTKVLGAGDLEIYFKPLTYQQATKNSVTRFEEEKLMTVIESAEISEDEKLKLITEAYKKVSTLGVQAVEQAIHYIKTPDQNVSEREHIREFLNNCDKKLYDAIRDRVVNLNTETQLKPLLVTCDKCNHNWEQPFTLDMSNFFE